MNENQIILAVQMVFFLMCKFTLENNIDETDWNRTILYDFYAKYYTIIAH